MGGQSRESRRCWGWASKMLIYSVILQVLYLRSHIHPVNFFQAQDEPYSWYCCRVIAISFMVSWLAASLLAPSQVERMGLLETSATGF